ncbi:hypothetical protein M409DRAFT_67861 [Zasmidium cellare ATCC 36951]|uniref:DNA damage-inducible protein 1 n=1 Tax=Zasmidium cellare ATCC 36951 TaxID=1080233 RepID=A0A6A6CAV0_ZASCE|nr:uncharacterized protein M409DRAFT_67861 [Zasmidium cellare ATCC 36951]KAF2164317.1 hypothetical protein M409DRAFT_67861 [Zasmidium cellare ATCC 36951]
MAAERGADAEARRPSESCRQPAGEDDPAAAMIVWPRVTISIIAPNHELDQELLTLDLPPGLSIADLKAFVTAETNFPQATQQFYLNNQVISGDNKTLEEAGIKDGDMLAMLMRQPQQQQNNMGSQRRQPQQQQQQQQRGPTSPQEIETTRLSILGNPGAMAQVRSNKPALAEAINDSERFREVWLEMLREDADRENERMEQMRLLNEDPFNIEAQAKIEEMIRQQSVQENLQFAYEHSPEATIDLKQNKLIFGDDNEVSFLGEADIPKYMEEAEPTIAGPNGTEIGAQSGTVKPAGSSSAAASSSGTNGSFQGQGQTLGAGKAPAGSSTPAASAGAAPAASRHPKEAIDQLIGLGFNRQQAIAALDACDGNVEYAAGLLFQG